MRRQPELSPTTRFIGRKSDLKEIHARFEDGERLITVWGTAGMGKTRLAIEYGIRYRHAGGTVVVCDLSEAHTPSDLLSVVASSVGVSLDTAEPDEAMIQLGHALALRSRLLVIFDNFEQLVESGATLVASWLKMASRARFLVTSRERLRIEGEGNYELMPLSLADEGGDPMESEAVQLFVDRAQSHRVELTIDETNVALVMDLVARLEGIPLAIELAAARIDMLGLKGLRSRLAERLDALSLGGRDAQPRQATLRGAIAWSWDLLDENEQHGLGQCSVFQGGFTLEAAEHILDVGNEGASVLEVLQSLRDKSLLRSHLREDAVRFSQYRSVQAFSAEALEEAGEGAATAARHTAYYLKHGTPLAEQFEATGSLVSLQEINTDMDNLLAVLERSLSASDSSSVDDALRAVLIIQPVLAAQRPLPSHLALLDRILDAAGSRASAPELLAGAYRARGNARRVHGRTVEAQADLEQALSTATGTMEGSVLADLGVLQQQAREMDAAETLYRRALTVLQEADARREAGRVLGNLGALYHDVRRFEDALTHYRRALAIFGDVGDQRLQGIFLANLGILELEMERLPEARTHFKRALMILEEVGDNRLVAITLGNLGTLSHIEGDLGHAERCHKEALSLLREVGDRRSEGLCLGRIGGIRAALSDCDAARIHLDEAEMLLERLDDSVGRSAVMLQRGFIELAEAAQAQIHGDTERLQAQLDAVGRRMEEAQSGSPSLVEQSDDARTAIRLLTVWRRQLDPKEDVAEELPAHALLVGPDAQWCRPAQGDWVDLRRRKAARGILAALVDQHRDHPGQGISTETLVDAGWPDENMVDGAGVNRVHVALNQLRKLGLTESIIRNDEGYLLDPTLAVKRVTTDWRALDGVDG